jgi:hypothetical protein
LSNAISNAKKTDLRLPDRRLADFEVSFAKTIDRRLPDEVTRTGD